MTVRNLKYSLHKHVTHIVIQNYNKVCKKESHIDVTSIYYSRIPKYSAFDLISIQATGSYFRRDGHGKMDDIRYYKVYKQAHICTN